MMAYLADVLHFEQCAGGFTVTYALWAVHIYMDRLLLISVADPGPESEFFHPGSMVKGTEYPNPQQRI
jgi:hypothetical protein